MRTIAAGTRPRRLAVALLFATLPLGGCSVAKPVATDRSPRGDSNAAVAAVVRAYVGAVAEGRSPKACAYLTAAGKRGLIDYGRRTFSEVPQANVRVDSCATAFRAFAGIGSYNFTMDGVMDFCLASEFPKAVDVTEVTVTRDRATARVARSRKKIPLRRIGGEWKIDAQDFSDAPSRNESEDQARQSSCARN